MFSPNVLGLNIRRTKKANIVLDGFVEEANESNCKLNKLWVDQGREFYNNHICKG